MEDKLMVGTKKEYHTYTWKMNQLNDNMSII